MPRPAEQALCGPRRRRPPQPATPSRLDRKPFVLQWPHGGPLASWLSPSQWLSARPRLELQTPATERPIETRNSPNRLVDQTIVDTFASAPTRARKLADRISSLR